MRAGIKNVVNGGLSLTTEAYNSRRGGQAALARCSIVNMSYHIIHKVDEGLICLAFLTRAFLTTRCSDAPSI